MITFETVTSINDAEFNELFWASLPSLDSGTYPWHLYGTLTDLEKRDHIRAIYDRLLTEGFVWTVSDDDGVLMLNAGVQDGAEATWLLCLLKPNAAGSKSYLYATDYQNARSSFWASLGVTSWTIEIAGTDNAVNRHMASQNEAGTVGGTMTETARVLTPDLTVTDATIR